MEFSCGKCATRYSVPDEKVRGKRVRTRCRKCAAEILIDGPPALSTVPKLPPPPAVPRSPVPPPRADERWTVAVSLTEQRRMTTAEIVDAYSSSIISDLTLVWKQGMEEWQSPFEIPAVALALTARGVTRNGGWREPGRMASVPTPVAPADRSLDAIASDWDDESEATRVSADALPFVARMLRPEVAAPPRPIAKPPLPSRAPARSAAPAPAPVSAPAPPLVSVPAPAEADTSPPPTSNAAFLFDDEATAVIGADHARALLEAQTSDTPIAFGFDEESTEIIAPDRAQALLHGEIRKTLGKSSDPAPETPAFPGVEGAPRPAETSAEPSIVVAEPKKPAPPEAPKAPVRVSSNPPEPKDIIRRFQNEPTRVVRVVTKKKSSGKQLWVVLALSLVAAAAGGFIASEILARQHPTVRPRTP